MRNHTTHTRDAALRELRRVNRWMIAGSIVLTGVLSDVAANAFPGKTLKATAEKGHSASQPSSSAKTSTGVLKAPAQAPQSSTESAPSQEAQSSQQATPSKESAPAQESSPSQESAPAKESAPAQESAPSAPAQESTPTPEASRESAPAQESSPPVVSGGS
jgi:hypothetical protein